MRDMSVILRAVQIDLKFELSFVPIKRDPPLVSDSGNKGLIQNSFRPGSLELPCFQQRKEVLPQKVCFHV